MVESNFVNEFLDSFEKTVEVVKNSDDNINIRCAVAIRDELINLGMRYYEANMFAAQMNIGIYVDLSDNQEKRLISLARDFARETVTLYMRAGFTQESISYMSKNMSLTLEY